MKIYLGYMMNVVVEIAGRDALPVWTIPYVTAWDISADMLVKRLVAPKYNNESTFPSAFNLDSDRKPHLIPSIVWTDYVENSISDFEDEQEDDEITQRKKRNKWRMDCIEIIMQIEGCYIWLDEFKEWLKWYNDFINDDTKSEYPILLRQTENGQEFIKYRIELWLTPSLPPEHARHFEKTELVNEIKLQNPLSNENNQEAASVMQALEPKPWEIADPKDPQPEQPWYTPARYFARQLVISDSTLLTKRDKLADKVVQSLTKVGIKKRGWIKPFDSATILKALSNVILS
jgi:hypothetical protein